MMTNTEISGFLYEKVSKTSNDASVSVSASAASLSTSKVQSVDGLPSFSSFSSSSSSYGPSGWEERWCRLQVHEGTLQVYELSADASKSEAIGDEVLKSGAPVATPTESGASSGREPVEKSVEEPVHKTLVQTFDVRTCQLKSVTMEERECFQIILDTNSSRGDPNDISSGKTDEEPKVFTFLALEKSYDIDWWLHTLMSVKQDLEEGKIPEASFVCPPLREIDVKHPPVVLGVPVSMARRKPRLISLFHRFQRYTVYETKKLMLIVGSDPEYSRFRFIKLDRMKKTPHSLAEILTEDKKEHSWEEMEAHLQILNEDSRLSGGTGLRKVLTAVALVGFVKFLKGYYAVFITQTRKIGHVCGHGVFGIQSTHQLSVSAPEPRPSTLGWINNWLNPSPEDEAETKYLGLFHFIDLTKDFFFSYSYDITRSLQQNMTCSVESSRDAFAWNHSMTLELNNLLSPMAKSAWIQPLVFGSFQQVECSTFGKIISVKLVARRSRHFAGTRYRKRGVADTGKVANDVEIEQIVEDVSLGNDRCCSFVQHRGSIPIFWSQETSVTNPKPPIVLNRVDTTYTATTMHFADLFQRYGSPTLVFNLIKQSEKREREVIVGSEFVKSILYINSFLPNDHRIRYVALDYSKISKQKDPNVFRSLERIERWAIQQTGFFCNAPRRMETTMAQHIDPTRATHQAQHVPPTPLTPREKLGWLEQNGIVRTNCIDCIDRTNVAQLSLGLVALAEQLYALGIKRKPFLNRSSPIALQLTSMYTSVGDDLAMQYGGSEAHQKTRNIVSSKKGSHREILTSIKRYYSNSFTDMVKQDAINLFLGYFTPKRDQVPLWELETDYFLHNEMVTVGGVKIRKEMCDLDEARRQKGVVVEALTLLNTQANTNDASYVGTTTTATTTTASAAAAAVKGGFTKLMVHRKKETLEERQERHRRRKREALSRSRDDAQLMLDALRKFEQERHGLSVNEEGRRKRRRTSSSLQAAFASFRHLYNPRQYTSFDVVLGYEFMTVVDISSTSRPFPGRLEEEICKDDHTADWPSSEPMMPPSSFSKKSRLQELGTPKFVQSLHAKKAPDCYLRYVELHEHPLVWEQRLDNESVLKEYRLYLRHHEFDPNNVHVPRGQEHGSLDRMLLSKIQNGVHPGFDQRVKALPSFLPSNPTIDPESERLYEESIDMDRLTRIDRSTIPMESMDIYQSFFQECRDSMPSPVPSVQSKRSASADVAQPTRPRTSSISSELVLPHTEVVNVGPLLRLRGKLYDYVLFNQCAANEGLATQLAMDC